MLDNHIIVGYGKWAKKIVKFLVKYRLTKSLIIIRKKKVFIHYPFYKKISLRTFNNDIKNYNSAHICSDNKTHLRFFNLFTKYNLNFIVEKPLVNNLKEFNKLSKNKNSKFLVNYIDLFNPQISKVIKLIKINKNKQIKLVYSNNAQKYKKKFELINVWLDHPLSIILFLFKRFSKFKIKRYSRKMDKNGNYKEIIEVFYKYKKNKFIFSVSNFEKKRRAIEIEISKKKSTFNLDKNNHFTKTAFYNLYSNLKKIEDSKFRFNNQFHKKILIEKNKILTSLK